MTLIDLIKTKQVEARKAKDSRLANVYTTLLGEALFIGKNDGNRETTDNEVIAVIKKFIKNINDTASAINKNYIGKAQLLKERLDICEYDLNVLNTLLPKQLTQEEIKHIIIKQFYAFGGRPSIGDISKYMKENFEGKFNGKDVFEVSKTLVEENK